MKNIIKTNKRGIIAILTLCMLLNTIGICAYATAIPEDNMATPEDTTVVVEETVVATEEPIIVTEENIVVTEENTQELMPMMANQCEDDDYYIKGEPDIPVGAMPIGLPTIGGYVSNSFLNHVVSLGYPDTNWYYYMQDYRLPNGQLVKYHIWANDYLDIVFYHKR